jgi:hypothetical protein
MAPGTALGLEPSGRAYADRCHRAGAGQPAASILYRRDRIHISVMIRLYSRAAYGVGRRSLVRRSCPHAPGLAGLAGTTSTGSVDLHTPRVGDHHTVTDHHLVLCARGNLGYRLHSAASMPGAVHPDHDRPRTLSCLRLHQRTRPPAPGLHQTGRRVVPIAAIGSKTYFAKITDHGPRAIPLPNYCRFGVGSGFGACREDGHEWQPAVPGTNSSAERTRVTGEVWGRHGAGRSHT